MCIVCTAASPVCVSCDQTYCICGDPFTEELMAALGIEIDPVSVEKYSRCGEE